MSNLLTYKSYSGSVEVSMEDDCLFGHILFINDIISFEGNNPSELKKDFERAVDHYIHFCAKTGKEPNKPFSGVFNVRTTPELHKSLALKARELGLNQNQAVNAAFEKWVCPDVIQHEHTHNHQYLMVDKSFSPLPVASSNSPTFVTVTEFQNVRVS